MEDEGYRENGVVIREVQVSRERINELERFEKVVRYTMRNRRHAADASLPHIT